LTKERRKKKRKKKFAYSREQVVVRRKKKKKKEKRGKEHFARQNISHRLAIGVTGGGGGEHGTRKKERKKGGKEEEEWNSNLEPLTECRCSKVHRGGGGEKKGSRNSTRPNASLSFFRRASTEENQRVEARGGEGKKGKRKERERGHFSVQLKLP